MAQVGGKSRKIVGYSNMVPPVLWNSRLLIDFENSRICGEGSLFRQAPT